MDKIQSKDKTTKQSIIYFARLTPMIFFWPIISLIGATYVTLFYPFIKEISLFFVGFAILWVGATWVSYYFSSLTIKNKQVVLRTGLIVRQTVDIPLNKIESIDIRQSILGSLLHYGSLVITGTGGTHHLIHYLSKPLTCRRYIEQLMHED